MTTRRYFTLTALWIALAGCQTTPTAPEQECPVVQATVCPVCEVIQCPTPSVVEKAAAQCDPIVPPKCELPPVEEKHQTIGEKEWAYVEPGGVVLEARIDTGAETSSIHAEDIQLIEKDGKRWVRFSLTDPKTNAKIPLERRLHRRIRVKQKNEETQDRRYVVRMWVTMGDSRTWLDLSLSDREDFEFPLLIGRNMLMDDFVVDISKHHTLTKPIPAPARQEQ